MTPIYPSHRFPSGIKLIQTSVLIGPSIKAKFSTRLAKEFRILSDVSLMRSVCLKSNFRMSAFADNACMAVLACSLHILAACEAVGPSSVKAVIQRGAPIAALESEVDVLRVAALQPQDNSYVGRTISNSLTVSGVCITGTVAIRVQVADASITANVPCDETTGDFSAQVDLSLLPDGPVKITIGFLKSLVSTTPVFALDRTVLKDTEQLPSFTIPTTFTEENRSIIVPEVDGAATYRATFTPSGGGQPIGPIDSTSPSISVSSLNVGTTYTIAIEASDAAGNVTVAANTGTFTKTDTDPPVFSSMSLANDALDGYINDSEKSNTTALVQAPAASGYTSIKYGVAVTAAACSGASFNTTIPTPADLPVGDGSYKVCVELKDAASNTTYGASGVVVLDTVSPVVTLASSNPTSPSSNLRPRILGSVTSVSTVTLFTDSACTSAISDGSANSAFTSPGILLTSNVSSNTSTNIYANAIDLAGNTACTPTPYAYVHDAIAPTLTSTSVTTPSPGKSATPAVEFTLSESATVTLYNGSSCSASLSIGTLKSSGAPQSMTTSTLSPNGTTEIYARAVDAASNSSTCTSINSYTNDIIAPTISGGSVTTTSPGTSLTPDISFTLSQDATVTLYSDIECSSVVSGAAAKLSGANTMTTNSLDADAMTTIYAQAIDTASNTSCTIVGAYTHQTAGSGCVFNTGEFNNTTVTGPCTFNGDSYNMGTVTGNATFNDSAYNSGTITGNATFSNSSVNSGYVNGNATFVNGNNAGMVGGTCGFSGTGKNGSICTGDTTFTSATAVNIGTIDGNAIFPGAAYNPQEIGSVTGTVTFTNVGKVTFTLPTVTSAFTLDSSTWSYTSGLTPDWVFQTGTLTMGTAKGSVTFNGDSYNSGTITGNATFNDSTYNSGTVTGNATFNGTATNYNTVTGNATFANGNNSGTVNGTCGFSGTGNNTSTCTGNTTFTSATAVNTGSIGGNAIFPGTSYNPQEIGSVTGTVTFTNVGKVTFTLPTVTSAFTLDSSTWSYTSGLTPDWVFQTGTLTMGTAKGSVIFNGDSYNSGTITGNATFNDSTYNSGTVTGNAAFNGSATNYNTVTGNATFANGNNSGTVNGTCGFSGTGNNTSTCTGDTTFISATAVNTGSIGGNAIFPGAAYNPQEIGSITGSVTFTNVGKVTFTLPTVTSAFSLNSSTWSYTSGLTPDWVFQTGTVNTGTAKGSVTFNGDSYNSGTVTGNATFNDSSYNSGTVTGNATFNGTATNYNTVTGNATFANGNNSGTVNGTCGFSGTGNNTGTCTGDTTFTSATAVNIGTIDGNAIFPGAAYNPQEIGSITGSVTFTNAGKVTFTLPTVTSAFTLDSSTWSYTSGLTPDWVFQTGTLNTGTATGSITFNGDSYNSGTVTGNATFADGNNSGTVTGTCSFSGSGSNSGTCG
jgi:hypothetical protein